MEEENKKEEDEKLDSLKEDLNNIVSEEEEGEKLDLLRREEIKTMAKDIRKLREIEAQKEKERITTLEKEKVKEKKPKKEEREAPKEIIIPKPPKKPWALKKILVRVVFALIFVSVAAFAIHWIFNIKLPSLKKEQEESTPSTTTEEVVEKEEEQEPEEEKEPQIIIPSSFIPVGNTTTLEISQEEKTPAVLELLGKEEFTQEQFTRLVLKRKDGNQLLNLEEITERLQIDTVPEEVKEKLDKDNFNFFIYPQKEGKRMVLVVKIKQKDNLAQILKTWEGKITQEGLFISGKQIPTLSPAFKNFSFHNTSFRYLTISNKDLGVCYATLDDYFILSSSFAGMEKIIIELKSIKKSSVLPANAGQLFMVGFEGEELTPQLESFFKEYKPGGVLLLSKNIKTKEQVKNLTKSLQELSQRETGLPLFIAADQEGGSVSRIEFLEEKTAQSEIEYTDKAYEVGLKRGAELKDLGININLAPLLDNMGEEDFYYNRSFQKDPSLTGELAKSLILGQKEGGVLTALKHFPGYVNVPFNPEKELATLELPEILQFQKAVEAEPELIMVSNAVYKEIDPSRPLTFSSELLPFLEENLTTKALIMSDDLAQNSLLDNFNLKEIVTKPINEGVNVLIFSGWRSPVDGAMDAFFEAIQEGEISETRLQESISKIIQLKKEI